jgi:hypothetical protein
MELLTHTTNSERLIESVVHYPIVQDPAIDLYPEPREFSPHRYNLFHLNIF